MLLQLPQLLAPDKLNEARALLSRARWVNGSATAGSQAAAVKNNQQLQPDSAESQALQQMVLQALDASPRFLSAALPRRVLPPAFNRYAGATNAYGNHVDQAVRQHPATRTALRTDLSCTLFLTPPADYEGGELVVQQSFGDERVKLPAGSALLYPASSVHRVEPVLRGERLACFFWVESLVRNDAQRQLLFDMDMALLALRQRHGEGSETVALTGTYHNLLRQWAET